MLLGIVNLILVMVIAAVGVMGGIKTHDRLVSIETRQAEDVKRFTARADKTDETISQSVAKLEKGMVELSAKAEKNAEALEESSNKRFDAVKNEASALRSDLELVGAKADEALAPRSLTYTGVAYINLLDTSAHDEERHPDAGQISYKRWSQDALDIVGASSSVADDKNRKVRVWDQLITDKVQLGDKFTLDGKTDSEWLRLMDKEGKEYYGGYAAASLYAHKDARFAGGASVHNPDKKSTHFPFEDGKNYIRGDTELTGNFKVVGDVRSDVGLCVQDVCMDRGDVNRVKTSGTPECRDVVTPDDAAATVAGGISSLARLDPACNRDERLTGLKLETQGTGATATVRYRYRCCK